MRAGLPTGFALAFTMILAVLAPSSTAAATACAVSSPTSEPEVRSPYVSDPVPAPTQLTPDAKAYLLHIPEAAVGREAPLLLAIHGTFGSGPTFADNSALARLADEVGAVVAFPSGSRQWNTSDGSPDVAFMRDVVEDARRRTCIDPRRIHVVGHSNGGLMVQRLVCEASDLFASAVSMAGGSAGSLVYRNGSHPETAYLGGPCDAAGQTHPASLALVGGTNDEIVPHATAKVARNWWSRHYGCDTVPSRSAHKRLGSIETFDNCEHAPSAQLAWWAIPDQAHHWPNGCASPTRSGQTDCDQHSPGHLTAMEFNRAIWEFLDDHRRVTPAKRGAVPHPSGPSASPSHMSNLLADESVSASIDLVETREVAEGSHVTMVLTVEQPPGPRGDQADGRRIPQESSVCPAGERAAQRNVTISYDGGAPVTATTGEDGSFSAVVPHGTTPVLRAASDGDAVVAWQTCSAPAGRFKAAVHHPPIAAKANETSSASSGTLPATGTRTTPVAAIALLVTASVIRRLSRAGGRRAVAP